jgi:hypothetical protein
MATMNKNRGNRVRLGDAVSLTDVEGWGKGSATAITFELTKQSAFSMLAEGVAVAKLYELARKGVAVSVEVPFAKLDDLLYRRPRVLEGLFGLALVALANSVRDAYGGEAKLALQSSLWSYMQSSLGKLGFNKRSSIVSRDPDYPIPFCLQSERNDDFPLPKQFGVVLRSVGQGLGGGSAFGRNLLEDHLLTFLWEAAKNAHEHARYDSNGQPLAGIRGIVAEKQVFLNSRELAGRKHVPELVRSYLQRLWKVWAKDQVVVCFTVSDLGPGIHRTVPQVQGESEWQRLNRAFEIGVSRKPAGSGPNRGVGLDQILEAAVRLRALLFVRSAELVGFKDFSNLSEIPPKFTLDCWPETIKIDCGTSISLLWSPKIARIKDLASGQSEKHTRRFQQVASGISV